MCFFVGLVIDTIEFKVFLTEEKIVKILSLCSSIPKEKKVTIRKFASLIGLVVHAFNTFMHYRNLEKDKILTIQIIMIWKCISPMQAKLK